MTAHPLVPHQVRGLPAGSAFLVYDFLSATEEAQLERAVAASAKQFKLIKGRKVLQLGGMPHAKGMVASGLPRWLDGLSAKMSDIGAFGEVGVEPNHVLVNVYEPGGGIMPHTDGPLYVPHFGIVSASGTVVMTFYGQRVGPPGSSGEDGRIDSTDERPVNVTEHSLKEDALVANDAALGTDDRRSVLFRVILPPRSLLVVRDELYNECLHGIDFTDTELLDDKVVNLQECGFIVGDEIPRTTRLSFTVRRVSRVLKTRLHLPGMR